MKSFTSKKTIRFPSDKHYKMDLKTIRFPATNIKKWISKIIHFPRDKHCQILIWKKKSCLSRQTFLENIVNKTQTNKHRYEVTDKNNNNNNAQKSLHSSFVVTDSFHSPYVFFLNDARYLLTIAGDECKIYAVKQKKVIGFWKNEESSACACCNQQNLLATASTASGTVFVRSLPDGFVKKIFQPYNNTTDIFAMSFSPSGDMLATGCCSENNIFTCTIHDTREFNLMYVFKNHQGEIYDLAFSPCETKIASSSADRTIRVWKIKSGREEHCLKCDSEVFCVDFCREEHLYGGSGKKVDVIAGGGRNDVKVWRLGIGWFCSKFPLHWI